MATREVLDKLVDSEYQLLPGMYTTWGARWLAGWLGRSLARSVGRSVGRLLSRLLERTVSALTLFASSLQPDSGRPFPAMRGGDT
jgi:hypothetical protein